MARRNRDKSVTTTANKIMIRIDRAEEVLTTVEFNKLHAIVNKLLQYDSNNQLDKNKSDLIKELSE